MVKLKLGEEAKDKITGFIGIIVGKASYLTGCDQYLLQPKCKKHDSKPDGQWFDDGRLEFNGSGINKEEVQTEKPGADIEAPKK